MLHWLIYNFLVLLTAAFAILEIGFAIPLAWIVLVITAILLVRWFGMIQWLIFNTLVLSMCAMILLDADFGMRTVLSPVAWLIAIVALILMVKDVVFIRLR